MKRYTIEPRVGYNCAYLDLEVDAAGDWVRYEDATAAVAAEREAIIAAMLGGESGRNLDKWLQEAMRQINALTPDVHGKAFDPDWFLLRNHLEDGVRVLLAAERAASIRARASAGA